MILPEAATQEASKMQKKKGIKEYSHTVSPAYFETCKRRAEDLSAEKSPFLLNLNDLMAGCFQKAVHDGR